MCVLCVYTHAHTNIYVHIYTIDGILQIEFSFLIFS